MKKLVILVLALTVALVFAVYGRTPKNDENSASERTNTEDKEACEKARKANTRTAWEKYLKKFPEGECVKDGIGKLRFFEEEIRTFKWSSLSSAKMNWYEADAYCKNLKEGGHSDWRLPIIDELRTIIKDCDNRTGISGECKKSENNGFLSLCDECKKSENNGFLSLLSCPEYYNYRDVYGGCDCRYYQLLGEEQHNFSNFGDGDVMLWSASSRSDNAVHAWGVDFSRAGIFFYGKSERTGNVRCIRQEEHDFCDTVKKHPGIHYWKTYLDTFPDGECADKFKKILKGKDREACENIRKQYLKADQAKEVGERVLPWINYVKDFPNGECSSEVKKNLEEKDKEACSKARAENTRAAWEKYLKTFPEGKCAEEGRSVRSKFKKIGGFEWSDMLGGVLGVYGEYCENLIEDGHKDWRLPTIDELRVLVQNHPGTVTGGKCRISSNDREIDSLTDACHGVKGNNFSKLGDTERIWSSSEVYMRQSSQVWIIDFSDGELSWKETFEHPIYIRCVRQDDSDACEAARKEETDKAWERYLFYFPKGKCAKEAEAEAKEKAVCERARKANTRAAWEEYLKKFPNGKCAAEGKAVRNKFKRIGNLEWSDVYYDVCENLKEDGYTDWRKPNIDELRTLVQNHPGTVTGGKCRISDLDYHLGEYFDDENCNGIGGFNFSKLGDSGVLVSLSDSSMTDYYKTRLF